MALLGGRSVHPVSVKVGGFSRAPLRRELEGLKDELLWARDAAVETAQWVAGFEYPEFTPGYNYVALRHTDEYPLNEGRVVASSGLQLSVNEFERHFTEHQVAYSTALHCTLQGSPYLVGPLARVNLNQEHLTPLAKQVLVDCGIGLPLRNPFHGIIARSVEILYALEESLRLIERYEPPRSRQRPSSFDRASVWPVRKRPEEFSIIATRWMATASSVRRRSFHRPHRTSLESNRTSASSCRVSCAFPIRKRHWLASESSAATILVFPARRIF